MKPEKFDHDAYQKACGEIDERAGQFAAGNFLPVMQWSLGTGTYSYNSRNKEDMLYAQLDGITETLRAENDQLPHLEPWHGVGVFAEAFGCPFIWVEDNAPWTTTIVDSIDQLKRLKKPELSKAGMLNVVLETTEFFNERTKGQIAIAATDTQSPLSTLSLICDVTWMLTEAWDYAEEFHRVLSDITDLIIEFTLKQRSLCSKPAAPGHTMWSPSMARGISLSEDLLALTDPEFYREFGAPYSERIAAALGGVGIHSCGKWHHNFETVKRLNGINMIDLAVSYNWDFDPVDPVTIKEAFDGSPIVVQARCKPEDTDTIDILIKSDIKLILSLWWNEDCSIRTRQYREIKKRWNDLKNHRQNNLS